MNLKQALARLNHALWRVDEAIVDADNIKAEVCESIRAAREAKNISLRTFAATLKISPAYLSDIERGNRFPASKLIERIEAALSEPGARRSKEH